MDILNGEEPKKGQNGRNKVVCVFWFVVYGEEDAGFWIQDT